MLFKAFFRVSCMLFAVSFLFPFMSFGEESLNTENSQYSIPSLIQSIQFERQIQYCDIPIPVERQEVKEMLEKEMMLALWDRPQVILWIKRSSRYFSLIEGIFKEYDLPLDLKYVPLVESALRPHASSSKGAEGFWQFLKSTGLQYGLRIDSNVDERKNIFKSTHAACRYIKDLEQEFGSYLLALSAYHMGEYGLKSEIEMQQTNDFFSLYLPLETQRYIFKIICVKIIIENQAFYGFNLKKSDLYPLFSFDKVNFKTDFQIPITLIAQAADIPFKTIKDMNPEIRGYNLSQGEMTILIPKGKAKGFKDRFTILYNNWGKTHETKFHIVRKGESLTGIAKKYEMSLNSLIKLNNLSINRVIRPGDRLVIE